MENSKHDLRDVDESGYGIFLIDELSLFQLPSFIPWCLTD